jgi:hypothetical protein
MNFKLYFQDRKLHPVSREIMRERFREMQDKGGWWWFTATQRNYTGSRYKYLFDYVYQSALQEAAKKYKIWNPAKAEFEFIETVEQLHTCMKAEFMRIQVYNAETNELMIAIDSSTRLDDKEFYTVFEEKVIQALTEMGCFDADGCMTRDEWARVKHPKKDLQNQ